MRSDAMRLCMRGACTCARVAWYSLSRFLDLEILLSMFASEALI